MQSIKFKVQSSKFRVQREKNRDGGKKKVLFFVEAMGGGVFTYTVELANALEGYFDMTVAYAVRPQTPKDYREYFDPRVQLIEVRNYVRPVRPIKDLMALGEMKRIAREVRPDIIHLHSSKSGALGRLAWDGKEIPLFYTPHGYSFLMEDCSKAKRAVYRGVEQLCARRRCTTVSCSIGEQEETEKLTERAVCIENGINTADLERILAGLPKEHAQRQTVFTLGRICTQKNPALFNRIAELLPERQFLWIGDGELRGELTAPNIRITGWTERAEALKMANGADVFLLTSLWEGLPISLLEAMYMKKLCIVSDVIGNRDVIRNGENGFVCQTAEEFRAAIQAEPEVREKLTEQAYRDLREKYTTKVMAEKYRKLYEESLK